MPTRYSMFRPLTPRSRWSEFFSNCAALMGIGRGPEIPLKSRPSDACYTDLPKGHYPGRGLLYSFLAHEIAIFAMLTVATATQLSREYRRAQEIWKAPEKRLTYLLPELGGGSSGEEPAPAIPATKSVGAQGLAPLPEEPAAPAAPAKPGLVYPAPQPIVSNPPNPTNRIQTILQPELVNPPTLQLPLALPNMVTIARAREPRPVFAPKVTAPPPAPAQTPSAPTLGPESHPLGWHFVNVQPMAPLPTPPQLSLPETSSNKFTPLPQNPATQVPNVAKAPAPATPEAGALKPEVAENVAPALPGNRERVDTAPKVSPSVPPSGAPASPEAAALKPEIGGGTDAHSVLVLSPTPGAPAPNLTILPGEARGHFAMGPEPNLNAPPGAGVGLGVAGGTGTASAGSATPESGATPATAGGTGAAQSAASRDLENRNLAPLTQGKGSGSLGGTGTSPGTGTGTTEGKGTGTGGDVSTGTALATGAGGSGTSPAAVKGKGSGTGPSVSTGPGTGAGTGPGTNPFSGITIEGEGGSRRAAAIEPEGDPTKPHPLAQTSYGVKIVATASSGGGLRDYGIFRNETAFTVYLDRSQDQSPSWILEYAEGVTPAPDPMVSSLTLTTSGDPQEQLTPPYPIDEEDPKFPPDVLARNPGRMVVVAGIMTTEGKLSALRIVQSPNNLLNAPALEALSKWTFRPAERTGQPVALKILLGIPLSSPPQ